MRHLYLSPHLDDAVLSCGGLIHRQANAGEAVTIATVCAGDPPAGPISAYAAALHARWGLPPDGGAATAEMVARRRAEDRAACARLGARIIHLGVPDVIYRRTEAGGTWTVEDDAGLFSGAARVDPALAADLARDIDGRVRDARGAGAPAPLKVYVPLAIGDHVDHHLVRRAAERWWSLRDSDPGGAIHLTYYEDYPYAEDDAAVARAVGRAAASTRAAASRPAVDASRRPAALSASWPEPVPSVSMPAPGPAPAAAWRSWLAELGEADLAAKVDAVAAYESQISSFWADVAGMAVAVRAFAVRRADRAGFAERLWEQA